MGVIAKYIGTDDERLLMILTEVVTIAGTCLLFTVIYKRCRRVTCRAKRSLAAAAFTTVLFNVGRIAIGLYLGHTDVAKSFGPAGSLAILLVWVDYAALALLRVGAVMASQASVLKELWRLFGARCVARAPAPATESGQRIGDQCDQQGPTRNAVLTIRQATEVPVLNPGHNVASSGDRSFLKKSSRRPSAPRKRWSHR